MSRYCIDIAESQKPIPEENMTIMVVKKGIQSIFPDKEIL